MVCQILRRELTELNGFFFRNIIPSLGIKYWGSKCRNKVPARRVGPAQVIEIRARPLIPLDRNAKFFR